MITHKLTTAQAKRIGAKSGTVVQCLLYKDAELPPTQRGRERKIAKCIYLDGRYIGGNLNLD